ncbi:MAG: bifunctional pyr operon transcriptional regulator/uracil phosphoribosyltransferase PyrR [Bacteroidia bacterium]
MLPRLILDHQRYQRTLTRLCYQLIENHDEFENSVIIGLQPRGILLGRSLINMLNTLTGKAVKYGELDTTFFRDDFRQKALVPQPTNIDFVVDDKKVILIDDVLFTGRSIRAALDALQHFGRPASVELLVLIDRRLSRHVPVQPDYVGLTVDAVFSEKVVVHWSDNELAEVELLNKDL